MTWSSDAFFPCAVFLYDYNDWLSCLIAHLTDEVVIKSLSDSLFCVHIGDFAEALIHTFMIWVALCHVCVC